MMTACAAVYWATCALASEKPLLALATPSLIVRTKINFV